MAKDRSLAPWQIRTVIEDLIFTTRQEILRYFRVDSCIASSRIALDVLRYFNIPAQPLAVRVLIFNAPYVDHLKRGELPASVAELIRWGEEDGSWSVGLGHGANLAPDRWDGHLVVTIQNRAMLDLSLDQASRPQYGMALGPLLYPFTPSFLKDGGVLNFGVNNQFLSYTSQPGNRGFEVSNDWRKQERRAKCVIGAIRRIESLLEKRRKGTADPYQPLLHLLDPRSLAHSTALSDSTSWVSVSTETNDA